MAGGVSGALLRPALELAWVIAREDQDAAPKALRRIVQFATLPPAALARVRRVVEEDEGYRTRVAEAAAPIESTLGRASWLWLVRPEGWHEELAVLDQAAEQTAASAREAQDERTARRRLAAAEEAKQRAEEIAAAAGVAAGQAAEDLTAERVARRAAEVRVAEAEAEVGGLTGRLRSAEQAVAVLESALTDARGTEAVLRAERDGLAAALADLEADLDAARGRLAHADDAVGDRDALARAVADAAGAARALGAALSAASTALGGTAGSPSTSLESFDSGSGDALRALSGTLSGGEPAGAGDPGGAAPASGMSSSLVQGSRLSQRSRQQPGRRRRPAALPPAVFEESAAAAEHLVRVTGMVLLVDGYNVSLRAWPDLAIPEQRRRLVDALAELVARTGVAAQVVFDGAEQQEPVASSAAPRSPVKVRFSLPDVDADEVLIEMVDQLPTHRPVVVATSDRRVQDEVRTRGANVITTPQLLGLLGRAR